MRCEEIKPLLAEFWSGTAQTEDRSAVEQHLGECAQCHAEADRLGALWRDLALLPAEEPGGAVRERFYEKLTAYRDGVADHRPAGSLQMAWRIAAGILLVVGGAGIGYSFRWTQVSAAEVTQLRTEVGTMRQLVTLSLLQQQSASDRLRGVSWAVRAEPSDTEVLGALLTAVNHDPSVNVRLAAIDALRPFASNRSTRAALTESLSTETEPIVQVALIDLLVDLKESGASNELRRMATDNSANSGVRERAEWALERLQ